MFVSVLIHVIARLFFSIEQKATLEQSRERVVEKKDNAGDFDFKVVAHFASTDSRQFEKMNNNAFRTEVLPTHGVNGESFDVPT